MTDKQRFFILVALLAASIVLLVVLNTSYSDVLTQRL